MAPAAVMNLKPRRLCRTAAITQEIPVDVRCQYHVSYYIGERKGPLLPGQKGGFAHERSPDAGHLAIRTRCEDCRTRARAASGTSERARLGVHTYACTRRRGRRIFSGCGATDWTLLFSAWGTSGLDGGPEVTVLRGPYLGACDVLMVCV